MRRITVWADDHTASRVTKSLEDMGVDYMSEAYAPQPMPVRRSQPEAKEVEIDNSTTVSLLKKKSSPLPLGKQVKNLLEKNGPMARVVIAKALIGSPYVKGVTGERKEANLQAVANTINALIKLNMVKEEDGIIYEDK